ncbi:SAM-dependent methyltransferase, MidA family [Devosia sp. YR412]|uniref:class I SAM-dependent methyltransferase n=1 Tax=Devosia sp. YR412 TaxID=1881030 RepID=UPI0008B1AD67|nr:SAM-dependent methyltransferase [Devosia sp. YR412]SEQ05508.1 SAM-dependent methyltransferase, MidA family [Devosia sp. YR412]
MTETTPTLPELIDMQIRTSGPMSIAFYMGLCLTHPSKGYYKVADPLGKAGDFVTAPEISQMFGELVGFFLVNLWQQMGSPKDFTLLELGPGRGTLMADVLRVACRAEGLREGLDLRLFETNPALIAEQNARLEAYGAKWIDSFEKVGPGPLVVISNEFFDALPIRQFVRMGDGWHERMVGLSDGKRSFGLNPTPIPTSAMPEAVAKAEPNSVFEIGLASGEVMKRLANVVSTQGGAILAVDYGYARTQTGETLQGVRKHAFADVLDAPGETDLSAHVDFEALGNLATQAGLALQPLATQGEWLTRMGINDRAKALSVANPGSASDIAAARQRLVDADQMGKLFKVFCAASPGLEPPGFA